MSAAAAILDSNASSEIKAKLRQAGGSLIVTIPKVIAKIMDVDANDDVVLSMRGRVLEITPAKKTLSDRLAKSPASPKDWYRDPEFMDFENVGRELL